VEEITRHLNELGNAGWDVAGMSADSNEGTATDLFVLLKRRK
jgi:hypothetical protein